jgi:hypothetical protein
MVSYTDGALTAGEYLALMQQRPPQDRGSRSPARATSSCGLAAPARTRRDPDRGGKAQGISTPPAEQDSARMELRRQLQGAAREAGLLGAPAATGDGTGTSSSR